MRPADILKLDEKHDVSFPNSVVELFSGVLACRPAAGKEAAKDNPARPGSSRGRPSANLEAVKWEEEQKSLRRISVMPSAVTIC